MSHSFPATVFCSDTDLGYERSRTRFEVGEGLTLDETYRLAHLPLVAPDHPRIIERREGSSYVMGRHERVFSLVLPVPGDLLAQSPAYRDLDREMRASPFADKIAWDLLGRRKDKLHATICGSLSTGAPPVLDSGRRRELIGLGPITVELRGLFSGSVNRGRLYLRAYPESRNGENVFRQIQRSLGCRETDLYVVGLYNMTDDLDALEAAALVSLIDRWWDRPIMRFEIDTSGSWAPATIWCWIPRSRRMFRSCEEKSPPALHAFSLPRFRCSSSLGMISTKLHGRCR